MKSSNPLYRVGALAVIGLWASGATALEPAPQASVEPSRPARPLIAERPPSPDAGWLGIQLAPVPAALASHLQLDQTGVMVRNVFRDSPADKAGLERYDVIVTVDGRNVDRGIEMFSQHIHSTRPGDRLKLLLYRGGQRHEVTVPLAAVPRVLDDRNLKYQDDPDVAQRRMFGLRGKILRPGPEGWVLDDLGELPDWLEFEGFFERDAGRQDRPEGSADELEEGRRVDATGQVLHVRKQADGSVEVRRYRSGEPQEQVESRTYADMSELRRADPEAAELLGSAQRPGPGGRAYDGPGWQRYQDSMKDYQEALRDYMKRYREDFRRGAPQPPQPPQWRDWSDRLQPGPWRPHAPRAPGQPPEPPALPTPPSAPQAPAPSQEMRVPEARFEANPDGSITVHVQDGPNQLTTTFPNERAFRQEAPELHERYRATLQHVR